MAPLQQPQPTIIVNRAPIFCEEMIHLKGQISKAERYLDNSEKLRVISLQFWEQLRRSQIEVNNGIEKLLQKEGAIEEKKL